MPNAVKTTGMDTIFEATSKVFLDGMKAFFMKQAENIFRIQKALITEDKMLNFPLVVSAEKVSSTYFGSEDNIPHYYWLVLIDGMEVESLDSLIAYVTNFCGVEKCDLSEKSLSLFEELNKAIEVFGEINAGDSDSEVTYQYGKMTYDLGIFLNNQRYMIQTMA